MKSIFINDFAATADTLVAFLAAFLLGTAIGFERQYRQRTAGLRTNVLVAIGAAAFASMGMRLLGPEGATRIISYVVSGIGFLGAGVIMKEGINVRGLNTAATLWCSAAVGAFCGSNLFAEAVLLTLFVLAGNTLLRPLVNHINRKPMDERVTEAEYRVHAVCDPEHVADVRDLLFTELELANYPIQDTEVLSESDDQVEIAALLVPTTADPKELDHVVVALEKHPQIRNATWTVGTIN
ncbi:MAG: MgtC/SapB family protein [Azospirillaceae bacterium]|nr:MgtC/SapB family protein [Azospirillaceae bacterium]